MIEVLVTIVIIAFGLLGMAGLQSRMQVSEVEAYQRAQALVLLNDMANRIATNRGAAAASYVTGTGVIGTGNDCDTDFSSTTNRVTIDKREWCNAIQGVAEVQNTTKRGAMIGGRGCVHSLGNGEYMVTIAWQGLIPLTAPPASVECGEDDYDGAAGTVCVNDLCRRVVTTVVRIASLL
jgi:type IV pilus assembly protein PilV